MSPVWLIDTPIELTLKLLSATPRASTVSTSRWLVGSSRIRKLGLVTHMAANATRLFCPPLRETRGRIARSAEQPNRPRIFLYCSILKPVQSKSQNLQCDTQADRLDIGVLEHCESQCIYLRSQANPTRAVSDYSEAPTNTIREQSYTDFSKGLNVQVYCINPSCSSCLFWSTTPRIIKSTPSKANPDSTAQPMEMVDLDVYNPVTDWTAYYKTDPRCGGMK